MADRRYGPADGQLPVGQHWAGRAKRCLPWHQRWPDASVRSAAYVSTIGVEDIYDIAKVKGAGGTTALEKLQVPGVGWLAYMKDPEGNIFGMLQAAY